MTVFLAWLLLAQASPLPAVGGSSEPVLPVEAAATLQQLAAPHSLDAEVTPGWRWTGLSIDRASARFEIRGSTGTAFVLLRHPSVASGGSEGGSAPHLHLTVGADGPDGRAAAAALAAALAENDRSGRGAQLWREALDEAQVAVGHRILQGDAGQKEAGAQALSAVRWAPVAGGLAALAVLLYLIVLVWGRRPAADTPDARPSAPAAAEVGGDALHGSAAPAPPVAAEEARRGDVADAVALAWETPVSDTPTSFADPGERRALLGRFESGWQRTTNLAAIRAITKTPPSVQHYEVVLAAIHALGLDGEPQRVLELGAFVGLFVKVLQHCGHPAVGIDNEPTFVAAARDLGHDVVALDARELSLVVPGGSADLVVAVGFFHGELPEAIDGEPRRAWTLRVWREVRHVLRRGGWFLFNAEYPVPQDEAAGLGFSDHSGELMERLGYLELNPPFFAFSAEAREPGASEAEGAQVVDVEAPV